MRDIEAIFRAPDDREIEAVFSPQQREIGDDQPFGRIPREVLEEIWEWAWGTPEEEQPRCLTAGEMELFEWFSNSQAGLHHLTTLPLAPGKVVVDLDKFLRSLAEEIALGTESSRMRMGTLQSELRELRQAVS